MSNIETGKRWRFQFSLWTLMLAISFFAVFLSGALVVGPRVALVGAFWALIVYGHLCDPPGNSFEPNRVAKIRPRSCGNAQDAE